MSSSIATFAAALLLQVAPQAQSADPTALPDIVVEGRTLEAAAARFVDELARPARSRGLARWADDLCIGVANLPSDYAQPMIDRISDIAAEVGLRPGEPGCRPKVFIIATTDGAALATALVRDRGRSFTLGSTQTDAGSRALEAFQTSDRAVRWWQTSIPVDSETGERAIRLAGDINPATGRPAAPQISVNSASRLNSQIRDDLSHVLIIVDIDKLEGTSFAQLTDHVALIALAQIDAEAETAGLDTIMSLFSDPMAPSGLTEWDMSYLRALYATHSGRTNPAALTQSVADTIVRDRRAAQAAESD